VPEYRKDPIFDRRVIFAEGRSARPHDFQARPAVRLNSNCPFCEGSERETPGELAAIRRPGTEPNSPGWQVRVVPNRYPALDTIDALPDQIPFAPQASTMPACGSHEVIIESPHHLHAVSQLSDEQLADVLRIYRDRLDCLRQDKRLRYGLIFKNVGAQAGASLEHLHSQLIATTIVPPVVEWEIGQSRQASEQLGECAWCRLVEDELASRERIVLKTSDFIAFCPFASRFPLETWIVPRSHASDYCGLDDARLALLARELRSVLSKLESALGTPAYNFVLHTTPFDTPTLDHYHWHIEIIPRVSMIAGFEWGAGYHINACLPEQAARVICGEITACSSRQD